MQIGCVYLISFQVNYRVFILIASLWGLAAYPSTDRYNVLFIISDDLTSTALSCYGNEVCHTPNIDRIAEQGVRFTRAYCQGTYCGPSRASFMSGYYPHAIGALGFRGVPGFHGIRILIRRWRSAAGYPRLASSAKGWRSKTRSFNVFEATWV